MSPRSSGESPSLALRSPRSSHNWSSSSRWTSCTLSPFNTEAQAHPQLCAPIFPHHRQSRAEATSQGLDRARKQSTYNQHIDSPAAKPRRTSLVPNLPRCSIHIHSFTLHSFIYSFIRNLIHAIILISPSFIHNEEIRGPEKTVRTKDSWSWGELTSLGPPKTKYATAPETSQILKLTNRIIAREDQPTRKLSRECVHCLGKRKQSSGRR